jgi:hypothetical protein
VFKDLLELVTELVKSPTAAWRIVVTLVVGGHIMWACGWVPGLAGFALAADVAEANKSLQGQLSQIQHSQRISLRIALAEEICRLRELRSKATENVPLWQQLDKTFREQQENYKTVDDHGEEYDTSQCSAPK